ncbi:MAG: hypothetical protein ACKOXB_15785 [Flavobacteriales bacterium]
MVTITGYSKKDSPSGGKFIVLHLEGGVQMVRSEESGTWFASALKTNIIASVDEKTCKTLVGTQLPGTIIKKKVTPYKYTVPSTGEERMLDYRYEYINEEQEELLL